MSEQLQTYNSNPEPSNETLSSLVSERLFYFDCSPEFARDRTRRAELIAAILNDGKSFGTERTREIIRSAFQVEVAVSKDAAEAASKMSRLISIVNLRLEKGLGLGPQGLPVKNTLYLVREGLVFTQQLSLDLSSNYKKNPKASPSHNHFAA